MSQKEKTKFRASAKWKKFRNYCKKTRMVDEITLRPLRAGWNLHHLDGREINYCDIENEERFMCLNKQMHETVHILIRYYRNDPSVMERLENCMKLMIKYSED